MRLLADRLGIEVPDRSFSRLVAAAGFAGMRARSADLVPDEQVGLFIDARGFFRAGTSGGWRTVFGATDLERYRERLDSMAGPELVRWLHREPVS
jgi:hypothetical protein